MNKNEESLSYERAHELLSYNMETGIFIWKVSRKNQYAAEGAPAGHLNKNGYIRIEVDGKNYRAHRLAIFMVTGSWPPELCDHKNKIKNDNRFENLRCATHSQNSQNIGPKANSTSGYKGVSFEPSSGKWRARFTKNGKRTSLGRFETAELAGIAVSAASAEHNGDFHHEAW